MIGDSWPSEGFGAGGKEGVLSRGHLYRESQGPEREITCPRAHSKSREDKVQARNSKALIILLTNVGELSTELHSENLPRWGQTKRVKGRVENVGVSSLSGDGTMEPRRDSSLGQLAQLCLHEPVQSWGQRRGQLSGLCHGFLGGTVAPGGAGRRRESQAWSTSHLYLILAAHGASSLEKSSALDRATSLKLACVS